MDLKSLFTRGAQSRFARVPADLPEDFPERDRFFVRKLSSAERDDYELSRMRQTADAKGKPALELDGRNTRAKLLVRCLCDAEGVRLFADEDADALGRDLPGDVSDRLFEQAHRFSGLERPEKN